LPSQIHLNFRLKTVVKVKRKTKTNRTTLNDLATQEIALRTDHTSLLAKNTADSHSQVEEK
jgi:hypothetical protein